MKITKRHINLVMVVFMLLFCAKILEGTWLDRIPGTFEQPDNKTEVKLYWSGDEFNYIMHDAKEYTIIRDPNDGWFCWAEHDKVNDILVSTGYRVNEYDPEILGLEKGANISIEKYLSIREPYDEIFRNEPIRTPSTGVINSITIFINFAVNNINDHGHLPRYSPTCHDCVGATNFPYSYDYYHELLNGRAAEPDTSLYKYIHEVSYGNLTLNSHIIQSDMGAGNIMIPYTAPNPSSYYRPYGLLGYSTVEELKIRRWQLLSGALEFAGDYTSSDLIIDSDNDGKIDYICFILRGSLNDAVWFLGEVCIFASYKTSFGSQPISINGKTPHNYTVNVEGVIWTDMRRSISTIAAEFSHCLGFADQYIRTLSLYDPKVPVGVWDLHGGTNYPPQSLTAYTKDKYTPGWGTIIETITESRTYTLYPLAQPQPGYPHAYRINSPYTDIEHFVIEYRSQNGDWIDTYTPEIPSIIPGGDPVHPEQGIPGTGLLVYRVRPSEWGNRLGKHYELYAYRPTDIDGSEGDWRNAHFSLEVGRTAINNTTNPAPLLSNGRPGGLDISNISSAGDSISFQVNINPIMETYVNPGYSNPANHVYETIQEAVDFVYPNGTVYIHSGIYFTNDIDLRQVVEWEEKNINIIGLTEGNDSVLIDCGNKWGFNISNSPNLNTIRNINIINIRSSGIIIKNCGDIIIE